MKINEHWIILIFCLCLLNAQRILPTDYKEYIESSGKINNMTREDRSNKYYIFSRNVNAFV